MVATMPFPPETCHAALLVAALATAFATKHLVADFLMQTTWMARGKERNRGWALPLLAHVGCHLALALALVLAVSPRLWWLAMIDFAIHLVVDRGKAVIARRGGWRPDQAPFWWLLGVDQWLHQLTNIGLAAALAML